MLDSVEDLGGKYEKRHSDFTHDLFIVNAG